MTHSISDIGPAYDYFNAHLFDGRLPPRRGKPRVELAVEDLDGCAAQCGKRSFGFRICFDRSHFGQDLAEDLSTLVHEMAHADVWRETEGGHDAPWRAWMLALGFDTDEEGRETPIAGGRFAQARDAWMTGRHQPTEAPVTGASATGEAESHAFSAFLLTLLICGAFGLLTLMALGSGGDSRYGGYSRYDYGGYSRYDDDQW